MGKDVIVACDFSSAKQVFDFLDKFTDEKPEVLPKKSAKNWSIVTTDLKKTKILCD